MKWFACCMLLLYNAGAFVYPFLLPSMVISSKGKEEQKPRNRCAARQQPKSSFQCGRTVVGECSMVVCRSMAQGPNPDITPIEDNPPDVSTEMPDFDLKELLNGLNIGSPRKATGANHASGGDIDEMKLIIALRKEMGEADFHAIFDSRNPRIGEL